MEQAFVCVLDGQTYCILVPLNRIEGLLSGMGLVFKAEENTLRLIDDEGINSLVFKEYYSALRMMELKKGA